MRRAVVALVLCAVACASSGTVDPEGTDPWGEFDGGPQWEDDPAPQPPPEGEAEPPLPSEDPDASPPEPPEPPPWPADAGEPPPPPEPTEDGGAAPADAGAPMPPQDGGPPPPPPASCRTSAGPLSWSCDGPIAGQECVAITEPADPNGWTDNYLCSVIPMGLRWSHAGPLAGMRCTQVNEAADPHGWDNNYLCLPSDSPYVLHWSVAGPIPGRVCHAWVEPSDPHTWTDNHLCVGAADPVGPSPIDPMPTTRPPRFEAVFSQRPGNNRGDTTVEDRLVEMIGRALPGSRVRVAVYTFTCRPEAPAGTCSPVADALLAAHRRGVDVRLVVDGDAHQPERSAVPGLVRGLGRARVTSCDAPGTACLGTGIMHHKTFLFSALDDGSRSVVVQGSHNLTTAQLRRHNNLVIVRGDSALFAAYERTFADQRRDIVRANYYRIDDGNFGTRVYFFPRTTGDTAASIVHNVNCSGGGRIRVAMAFFTNARLAVAQALAARQRAGCTVEVVAGNDEIAIGRDVLSTLRGAGVAVTLYPRRSGWALHSKYMLIDARYAGSSAPRRLVFTGSHNWTGPALRYNDETLLRVDNAAVYDAFLADFGRVRAAATRP